VGADCQHHATLRRFTPSKHPVLIVYEAGCVPGPFWTGAKNLATPGLDSRTVHPLAGRCTAYATPAHVRMTYTPIVHIHYLTVYLRPKTG